MTTITWLGSNDEWSTAAAWSGGTVPSATDDVVVDQGAPTLDIAATIHSLTIGPGGNLVPLGGIGIYGAPTLHVIGDFINAADYVTSNGLTVDGIFTNTGSVVFPSVVKSANIFELGSLHNTGSLTIASNILTHANFKVHGDITGNGIIHISRYATQEFGGAVEVGQIVEFGDDLPYPAARLTLDDPVHFAGTVTHFSSHVGGFSPSLTLKGESISALEYDGTDLVVTSSKGEELFHFPGASSIGLGGVAMAPIFDAVDDDAGGSSSSSIFIDDPSRPHVPALTVDDVLPATPTTAVLSGTARSFYVTTATDPPQLTAVAVSTNGAHPVAATLNADGTWIASVALHEGLNHFTVAAIDDQDGSSTVYIPALNVLTHLTGRPYTSEVDAYRDFGVLGEQSFYNADDTLYCHDAIHQVGAITETTSSGGSLFAALPYTSTVTDYVDAGLVAYKILGITGLPYTGVEVDYAGGRQTGEIVTGITGVPYSSIAITYADGVKSGEKVDGISGQPYTTYSAHYAADGSVTQETYTNNSGVLTGSTFSEVRLGYSGGALVDVTYFGFPDKSYASIEADYDANGRIARNIYDFQDGTHSITPALPNVTLTGAGARDTFVFPANFGHDTITNFFLSDRGDGSGPTTDTHDTLSLLASEFGDLNETLAAAGDDANGDAVLTAANGDTITLQHITTEALHLAANASDILFT